MTVERPLIRIDELTVIVIVAPSVTVKTELNTAKSQQPPATSPFTSNPASRSMFRLSPTQLKKLAKGFGLAMAGAAVSFGISHLVPEIQASGPIGLMIAGTVSTALNTVLKVIENAQKSE